MRKAICLSMLVVGLGAMIVVAQQPQPADFAATLKNQYNQNKGYILASAAKWPADQYDWRPEGLKSELRTFGQTLVHIANENYMQCSRVSGKPAPKAFDDANGIFTKTEATKIVTDSFTFCDPVFNGLTNQSIVEMIPFPGRNNTTTMRPRGTQLIADLTHSNEQYGMIMIYFGLKGMKPPSHESR